MIHPVAACATTAVSIEEGVDKIRLGKAEFVVAGGFDDLSTEGIAGFSAARANVKVGKHAIIAGVRNTSTYKTNIGLVNLTENIVLSAFPASKLVRAY